MNGWIGNLLAFYGGKNRLEAISYRKVNAKMEQVLQQNSN
jgi:hypothetical protein